MWSSPVFRNQISQLRRNRHILDIRHTVPFKKKGVARTMSSKTLILAACQKGDVSHLRRVLEVIELDVGSEPLGSEGETALHVACAHGHLNIVQYLVNDRGCSVAVHNSRAVGTTPLMVAWAKKHWEVVEFLLNAIQEKELFAEVGLAPATVTQLQEVAKCGDEALHQACANGYLEVIKFLLCNGLMNETGYDPTTLSSHGTTPLQVAWDNKHWKVASYLLQAMRDYFGQVSDLSPTATKQLITVVAFEEDAFHVTCSRGYLEVVQYLHENLKCSLTQCNLEGRTPLDVARLNGHLHVIHFLLGSGKCSAPDMTKLHLACILEDEEKVRNLASDITSLSTPDQFGITAVHYATYQPNNLSILLSILNSISKQKDVLSLLVRQDKRGNTPLHYAALCGCTISVRILVSYYSSVNIQNADGDTPLHLSIKSNYCNSGLVSVIILHKSCRPSTINAQNESPLHTASKYGKLDIVELLLLTGKCNRKDIKVAIEAEFLLHQAIASGRLELVQALLKGLDCNINQFNSDGETPLHVACRHNFEILKLLSADKRCDLTAQNKDGLTALHITVASGDVEKYQLLSTIMDCIPLCPDRSIPLHVMVRKNFHIGLSMLLKHPNCNPNMTNKEGNSALHLAVRKHSFHCATCLLQHDRIDPNIQNNIGNTPLHETVRTKAPIQIMKSIIQHKKCNPCTRNGKGKTPLQIALEKRLLPYFITFITCGKYSHDEIRDAFTIYRFVFHQIVSLNNINLLQVLQNIVECDINETNEDGETLLHIASRQCSVEVVQMLVADKRCDLNVQNSTGETALHIAVYSELQSNQKVKCILHIERCNPNVTNNERHTPLHVAVRRKEFEIVEILLSHSKVNPNVQDNDGNTPLHICVCKMPLSNIEPFLNHTEIDLNIPNTLGNTPLHEAVLGETPVNVMEALIFHKSCTPSRPNYKGVTPLQITVDLNKMECVEVLVTSEKCNQGDIVKATSGTFLLHSAISSGRPKLVLKLIEMQMCNINETNCDGETPLHIACIQPCSKYVLEKLSENSQCNLNAQNQCGDTALHLVLQSTSEVAEKVQCIVQSERCNPNIINSKGYTPLHVAVRKKSFKSAATLLKHSKCDPNIQDLSGNTPLHMAIISCTPLSNVEPFLNHPSIDVNIQNMLGNTPLHEAVMKDSPLDVVEALILHKACSPTILNYEQRTPQQISVYLGKRDYEVLLVANQVQGQKFKVNTKCTLPLHKVVLSRKPKVVWRLIDVQKYTINETNLAGETAIHVACRKKHGKFILQKLLEDSRCDPNIQDQCGNTALHLALCSTSQVIEKVECILRNDRCNPNITNSEGYTPLHVTVSRKEFQSTGLLLKHSKCNPNIQDLSGNTPLHMAVLSKTSLLNVKLFLDHNTVDLNIQNREGNTPLHEAVMRQAPVDVVEALTLHNSCNVRILNNARMTPLQISIAFSKMDYIEGLCISKKYSHEDIVKATQSTLLLQKAVLSNCLHLMLRLIETQECNINETNSFGETALHIACRTRHKAIVKKLVEDRRCDLNAQNHWGDTALHLAVYSGTDVTENIQCMLHSERCNSNITNREGHTPLHIAVKKQNFETARVILNHSQCNPNIQDLTGNTPLHIAISEMSLSNVESFLNHKSIDLSIQNREGNTPLHEAVMRQAPVNVVDALTLHNSCNPSIANNAGMTPLKIWANFGKLDYAEVLITSGKCSHEDIVRATEDALLLHRALLSKRLKLFLRLASVYEYNINEINDAGETALHLACRTRCNKAILKTLVENSRCDLNAQDRWGDTALHLAVSSGTDVVEKVQCMLQSERCNLNVTNNMEYTPLHFAVSRKEFQSAAILLSHSKCNPNTQNRSGNTPLHEAVIRQAPVDVIEALIHKSCNHTVVNNDGMTPLQISVNLCELDYVYVMITSRKYNNEDILKATDAECTPLLHKAVLFQHLSLFLELLHIPECTVNVTNSNGETALHVACKTKYNEVIFNELVEDSRCDINAQDQCGNTPLHVLCSYGQNCDMRMLHTLLCTPKIDPKCANHLGQIPAELAESNYSVIEMISKYLEYRKAHLETYLKIFVIGNSGGGKSTLIKAVTTERSKLLQSTFPFRANHVNPSEVPPHTAGIVPFSFNSKHFGHAVLYDFAGQHEYYSSHAAVMENLVLPSPPLFLLLIDISKPMDEVKEELVYWWMFINNNSKRATAPPYVILVGSHEDIVKERGGNIQGIMKQIIDIVRNTKVSFQFDSSKVFSLDCRKLVSQGLTALLTQLKVTCQTLRQTADIDLHCHILKAFLSTKFESSVACKISKISQVIESEDVLLPHGPSQLILLLSTLSDKGHILLLENHTDVNKTWVVLKPELLLAEVNGSIFAPDYFKEHCSGFAMSTGVVALSKIRKIFKKINNQVIISYLTHLEFCFRIKDQHTLEMITKDELTALDSEHIDEYYFFPALIQMENPSDVYQPQETITFQCGWFYRCNEPTEQLTTRFLHVLILRLAFSCDPPDEPTQEESVVLLRSCSVWKHGIAWWTNDGIETIVEVGLQCRWVAVMLRCPDTHKVQCAQLRTKVISTVLKTKQDFCSAVDMKEFLIAPSSLQYPFEGSELTLYSMREIAKVVIAGKEFPKDTEGKGTIHISQLLPFEPFFNFGEVLIDNLFTQVQSREREISRHNMFQIANKCYKMLDGFLEALQPNPTAFQRECVKPDCTEVDRCVSLFQIIQRRGCKTWRDFEQEFSRFSVFCGRSPMVSPNLML